MARAAWVEVPLTAIVVGPRLRMVDPSAVANLAVSIEESGWFGAVLVRPVPSEEGDSRYALVAGAHRLAAMKALGRPAIPCSIRTLSDDEAEQIEIDENLVRRGLTALERAEMVAARLSVWRRRFPGRVTETDAGARLKRGRPSNSANLAELLDGTPHAMGFATETANEIGLSEKTIRNALAAVGGLPADLRMKLRGTSVAKNEGLLRQLAALGDKDEQAAAAEILISGRTKNLAEALAYAAGKEPVRAAQTPVDETVKAFRKLWGAASPSGRAAILHELEGKSLPKPYAVTKVAG